MRLLHWQIADLLGQVARYKLWWAVHMGQGSIGLHTTAPDSLTLHQTGDNDR